MEEGKRKIVMIVISVVCLGIAAAMIISSVGGDSPGLEENSAQFLCSECGKDFQLNVEEYRKAIAKQGGMTPERMMGPVAIECPSCGQETGYQAIKCDKCAKVFFGTHGTGDFHDRCPDCDYSAIEERKAKKSK